MGFDLVPRSPLYSAQMPAKAVSGLSSLSANQTTSFLLVSGFGSGAYSAKLLNGTRHRFSGFIQVRQCGDDGLRILVTGGQGDLGGGGIPHRIMINSRLGWRPEGCAPSTGALFLQPPLSAGSS